MALQYQTWFNDRGLLRQFSPKDSAVETFIETLESGVELRHSMVSGSNFSYTIATIVRAEDAYEMTGLTGMHSIGQDEPPARIMAHWTGFMAANEREYEARRVARALSDDERITKLCEHQNELWRCGRPHGQLMGEHVAYVYKGDGSIAAILDDTHADDKRSRLRLLVEASAMAAVLETLGAP